MYLKYSSLAKSVVIKVSEINNNIICQLQVIHHLDAPGTTEFPKTKAFLSECFRVLKPNGSLLINVHTPEQSTSKCMWYYSLLPEASKRQTSRYYHY